MKSVYGCIYAVWNPDRSHVYIGQTTKTPAERWAQHVKAARARKECPKLGNAIRKYERLGTPMVVEQIDTADGQEELDFLEAVYIVALDAVVRGYNCQAGGGGGYLLDEEAKERHRVGVKAGLAAMTDEAKARMHMASKKAIKVALAHPDVRARMSAGTKAGQAMMTPKEKAEWHANIRAAQNRPDVRARQSASVKAGMAAMTNEAWAETKANMHTGAKARWAREEESGRVLRSPEEREHARLCHLERRARRKAEGRPYVLSPEAKERNRLRCRAYRARRRAEKEGVTA